jgi:glycopeptide antibiotics resistance protein
MYKRGGPSPRGIWGSKTKVILFTLFCVYLVILSKLILFKHIGSFSNLYRYLTPEYDYFNWRSHNFIPFKTIFYYLFLAELNLNIKINNLVGNIMGFIPFGFMLPLLSKRLLSLKMIVVATFCISFSFEIIQLVFMLGSFDVDDLILNTVGGILGFLVIKLILMVIYYIRGAKDGSVERYTNSKS